MTRFGSTGPDLEPGDPRDGMGAVFYTVLAAMAAVVALVFLIAKAGV